MTKYLNRSLLCLLGACAFLVLLPGSLRILSAADVVAPAPTVAAAPAPKEKPLFKDFMGINGHLAFKPEAYETTCHLVRNYHPVTWDNEGDSSYVPQFPLSKEEIKGAVVDWTKHFNEWKAHGFVVDDCLQIETIKKDKWKNLDKDPFTYGEAYAKRLGPSGDNVVTSAEIGNEPAKWSNEDYRKIFENMAKGLRAGDPKLKIVTAAAAAGKPDVYSKPMSCLEGLENLYDVLNIHTYSMIEGWPTWRRVYPEHPDVPYLKVIDEMTAWRDAHAPGKEIWVTEFGYDANSGKKGSGDFEKWVSSTEAEQAQWLVRSFLVFSGMDVERAYIFYYDDGDGAQLHASSGLTRHGAPKPAFHAVAHLLKTLGDYRFSKVITKKDAPNPDPVKKGDPAPTVPATYDALYVYEYVNPAKPKEPIWVAWSPSGSQRQVKTKITLPPHTQVVKAEQMPMKEGAAPAVKVTTDESGVVELEVSESPTYLWLKQ